MENVNWFSILISSIIPMVIGFVYYHKAVFGNAWMKSIGMTEEKAREANMAVTMGLSFLMAVLVSMFLLLWLNGPGHEGEFDTFKHGAFHGLTLGLMVVGPIFISNGLFEQRTWKNMLINALYWTITVTAMGAILDGMNHFPNVI